MNDIPRSVREITRHEKEHHSLTRRVAKIASARGAGAGRLESCRTEYLGLQKMVRNGQVPEHLMGPVEWAIEAYEGGVA